MSIPPNSAWKIRLVEGGFPDCTFDIEFWQEWLSAMADFLS